MKRRTALDARLRRLEQRQLGRSIRCRVIIGIADRSADQIVAMTNGNELHVLRQASEPLAAFTERAGGVIASRFMYRVYSSSEPIAEVGQGFGAATA